MHRAGIFKSSVLVEIVNYVGLPLLVAYTFSMFIFPWIDGRGSWIHVQAVWDRWQTLNAGALAFIASLIAFNITRYNENLQRERDFVAAKAFLPSALSGLMDYFSRCASIYDSLWHTDGRTSAVIEYPQLPTDYREVFSNCIRHADPEVGSYLSNILVNLQVHDSRLRDVIAQSIGAPTDVINRYTLIVYFYKLGEIYALVANLFDFARGEEIFEVKSLAWEDFRNAYGILGIITEEIFINENMNLQDFTTRAIARADS